MSRHNLILVALTDDGRRVYGFTGEDGLAHTVVEQGPAEAEATDWVSKLATDSGALAARDKRAAARDAKGYDPRCCHKTVLQRCDGCPYDEKPAQTADQFGGFERAVPRLQEQKPYHTTPTGMVIWPHLTVRRPESLNDFAKEVHANNAHWWSDPATGARIDRNTGELLMLVVSEIAECMEGERKNLMDDHLPHRKMAEVELADAIIRLADIAGSRNDCPLDKFIDSQPAGFSSDNKCAQLLRIVRAVEKIEHKAWDGFAAQVVWAFALIEMYATKHGYDLWGAVAEKRAYNAQRADHKPEARLAANGKKF